MSGENPKQKLTCWCGKKFTGIWAGINLRWHQSKAHPGDKKNI